ncbi:MAG TPA: cytochrome c oxidase subunit II [Candidatus Limnocylindrales bacterium]|nr:cytochrome c oxidase subunit II [Candidatus Limnocylindrales bacterium]
MSMPSRPRTGSGALLAGLIILVVTVATIGVLLAAGITPQRAWDSFFPVGGAAPVTDRAKATRSLYDIVFLIGAAIFVIVEGMIVYTIFRYRRKSDDETLPPQTHGNNLVEVIWTAIPTAIVLALFVMSWQTLNTVEARTPSEVNVRAVAARYQWRFDYLDRPDGPDAKVVFSQALPVGEDGGLVLPVGEPIHISLTSPDVIHAFYVPKFLFKRDVVPGKLNTFDFTVDEPGTYRGQCAELCGAFHGSMIFEVHAKPAADFDAWLAAQIEKANATPAPQPSGEAAGPVIEAGAKDVAFTTTALTAPADTAFGIHFKNDDLVGVLHNIEIKDASGASVFKGDLVDGGKDATYAVPALAAGAYTFICTVHPNMTGTLTVQ